MNEMQTINRADKKPVQRVMVPNGRDNTILIILIHHYG